MLTRECAYFVPSVEVYAADVEAVNVRREDSTQEQNTIQHAIPLPTREHSDGEGREEYVDERENDAVEQGTHCVCM